MAQVRNRTEGTYSRYLLAYEDRRDQKREEIESDGFADHFATDLHDSVELAVQRSGRSADSMRGNALEGLAEEFAHDRYGTAACPKVLLSGRATYAQAAATRSGKSYVTGRPQPTLYTTYNHEEVIGEAAKLAYRISATAELMIGTPEFEQMLMVSREKIRAAPHDTNVWWCSVDLYVDDPLVGFGEIKAGAHLDKSKASTEVQKLLQFALANDKHLPVRAFALYDNAPGKDRIAGALTQYFTDDRLLVDEAFWSRVLPPGVSYQQWRAMRVKLGQKVRSDVTALRAAEGKVAPTIQYAAHIDA